MFLGNAYTFWHFCWVGKYVSRLMAKIGKPQVRRPGAGGVRLLITDFCFDTSWFTARAVHVWASCPISCLHASHDAVTAHLGLVPFFSCAYAHGYSYPWPTMAIILQTERRQSLACSTTPGRQPRLPLPMNPAKGSVVSSFIVMLGLSPLTAGANLQRSCEP